MNTNLQMEIFRRYPNLFRKPGKRLLSSEIWPDLDCDARLVDNLGPIDDRGIECGDEWFHLVNELSSACEDEIEALIAKGIPQEHWPRISQVKEKFGGLRFYVVGQLSERLRARILQVESASKQVRGSFLNTIAFPGQD
jgi:hypothetical protein